MAPEFSDAVADESSRNAMSNSVIRFGSQSSNEPLWTESDLEDYMRRCKKDWTHEEQGELMRSLKTLHELKESWKNTIHVEEVDKSDDENPRVPTRGMSRATEVGEEKDDVGMFMHSLGNPELEKIPEQKMMKNSGYRVPSVRSEFDEQMTMSSSGKSKRLRVWEGEMCARKFSRETQNVFVNKPSCVQQGIPGCASLIREAVLEVTRGHSRTHEIRRAMQREENRRNNRCGSKQVWMKFDGKSRPWDIGVDERGRELRERWEKENGMAPGEVRLMAEGRMVDWEDLVNLADGAMVQVLGNMRGGM